MCPNNEDVPAADESNDTIRKQEARAKLREGFLKAIVELQGQPINLLTYELSMLQATFSGWKPDGSEILVKDLTTPAFVKMPSALLRTPDILAIEFIDPVELT